MNVMRRDRYISSLLNIVRLEIKGACHGYVSINVFLKTFCHYSAFCRCMSFYITFGEN
jgi:hypothetical protein